MFRENYISSLGALYKSDYPKDVSPPPQSTDSACYLCKMNVLLIAEPFDTNFEEGWGIWEQGTTDDFDWELRTGGTPTLRTGPKRDHTTGDGETQQRQFQFRPLTISSSHHLQWHICFIPRLLRLYRRLAATDAR